MTDERTQGILDSLKGLPELCGKATPGPWQRTADEPSDVVVYGPTLWEDFIGNVDCQTSEGKYCSVVYDLDQANADFITAARTLLPVLLGMIEEQIDLMPDPPPTKKIRAELKAWLVKQALARTDVRKMMGEEASDDNPV